MDNLVIETNKSAFDGSINILGAGEGGSCGSFICLVKLTGNEANEDLSKFGGGGPAAL